MATDDPWDWDINRVVQELCTPNRSWIPRSTTSPSPDPIKLEVVLRENMVDGSTLLWEVTDAVLKDDFSIKVLGWRGFIKHAISELQQMSTKYEDYRQKHADPLRSEVKTAVHESLHEQLSRYGAAPQLLGTPRQIELGGFSTLETPQDTRSEPGAKRRKLDFSSPGEKNFEAAGPEEGDQMQDSHGILTPAADTPAEITPENKKRKRIAPTLITTEIDPFRNREIPTGADTVTIHKETGIVRKPGVTFKDEKGKKRMVPIHVSDITSGNDQRFEDLKQPSFASAPTETHTTKERPNKSSHDSLTHGYMGRKAIPVDQLFYGGVPCGEEIDTSDVDMELCQTSRISSGRRLYVHHMIRNFQQAKTIVFQRDGKYFSVVQPYDERYSPKYQSHSLSLYYATPDGTIHARRENATSWPEVSGQTPNILQTATDERTSTFNPLGPDMLNGLGSYDDWDPSSLEKYRNLEGGDEVLPLYGDSDEENEYDPETWREIELERGELERPTLPTKRPHLNLEQINEAIDEGISQLVEKWKSRVLPKREKRSWSLWMKSRKRGTKRVQIIAAQKDREMILVRIGKLRKEISTEIWTTPLAVQKQTRIMEVSIFTREDLAWKISLLEQKRAPEKPDLKTHSVTSKKTNLVSEDGDDGEDLQSESDVSSSEDGLGDFIIPDEEFSTLDEQHLADSEAENNGDVRMSDVTRSAFSSPEPLERNDNATAKNGKEDGSMLHFSETRHKSRQNSGQLSPVLKHEGLFLPKLPSSKTAGSHDIIDLTMTSSDEIGPGHDSMRPPTRRSPIDVTTPEPRRTFSISHNNRGSLPRLGADLSEADSLTELDGELPRYDDPASVARYSYEELAAASDRDRLVIKIVWSMSNSRREAIFGFIDFITEANCWSHIEQLVESYMVGELTVERSDTKEAESLRAIARLFHIYALCQYQPNWSQDTVPTSNILDSIIENQHWFPQFFQLCCQLESYFGRRTISPPANGAVKPIDESEDEDEPIDSSARCRIRSIDIDTTEDEQPIPISSSSARYTRLMGVEGVETTEEDEDDEEEVDDELSEQESPSRRKKKFVENADAAAKRAREQLRRAEQDLRRQKLHALMKDAGRSEEGTGNIIINDAAMDTQGLVYVNARIAKQIKRHQIEGVRFLWNQIITEDKELQGCLLAHTMGLGKTMQVITLLVAIAEASASDQLDISSQIPERLQTSRTLVLCPPTLIDNWVDELLFWVSPHDLLGDLWKVDSSINIGERVGTIADWYEAGGVLVMGYEMFRNFVNNRITDKRAPPLSEEQHASVLEHLLKGPNIVIADEAHKMKNASAEVTKAAVQFDTMCRIALTGSPLANNVQEYHTMIEWVSPNYLGPASEFRIKYVNPIEDGLYSESTPGEKRNALKKLGVLNKDLAPKVHRADMSVLKNDLPLKREFIIYVPLTDLQKKAYSIYVQFMLAGNKAFTKDGDVQQTTMWHWLAVLTLLCNHPACFKSKLDERKDQAQAAGEIIASRDNTDFDDGDSAIWKIGVSQELIDAEMQLFRNEGGDMQSLDLSNKARILCQILDAAKAAGEKTLVFSQSLATLDFLERLCQMQGRTYLRLDGKTKMNIRQAQTKKFNQKANKTDIMLISTNAGGLGLNLPGANRVVIFDFKFNPIQEEQAIGRSYRIGQTKETFVYRLVCGGTFEDMVHNKIIFKQQLASRVVDKKRPIARATRRAEQFLFEPKEIEQEELSEYLGMDPLVLDTILASQERNRTIRRILQSDTFEKDDNDKLTAEEEMEVQQMFKDEQLKRSDPVKWRALESSRAAQKQAMGNQAQQSRPQSTQQVKPSRPIGPSNTGDHSEVVMPPNPSLTSRLSHPSPLENAVYGIPKPRFQGQPRLTGLKDSPRPSTINENAPTAQALVNQTPTKAAASQSVKESTGKVVSGPRAKSFIGFGNSGSR